MDCLLCHATGSTPPAWLFGGTVYNAEGTTAAPHVEIGVKDGAKFFKVCSAANGNFWKARGTDTVTWSNAEVRARNASGEAKMSSKPTGGGCNSCHGAAARIKEP
jgi:hypothetical protein